MKRYGKCTIKSYFQGYFAKTINNGTDKAVNFAKTINRGTDKAVNLTIYIGTENAVRKALKSINTQTARVSSEKG